MFLLFSSDINKFISFISSSDSNFFQVLKLIDLSNKGFK